MVYYLMPFSSQPGSRLLRAIVGGGLLVVMIVILAYVSKTPATYTFDFGNGNLVPVTAPSTACTKAEEGQFSNGTDQNARVVYSNGNHEDIPLWLAVVKVEDAPGSVKIAFFCP